MFSNDRATPKVRKTSNMTLNTDKFFREEGVHFLQENFFHASLPLRFPLPVVANYFIQEKNP